MMDMLNRIIGLEDVLYKTNEQLTESRHREVGLLNLLREVVGHLNATEKGLYLFRVPRIRH
jgi:osomolarity two-component system response regulator SKN7